MDKEQTEMIFTIMYSILGTVMLIEIAMIVWLIAKHYELKRKDIYKILRDESNKKTNKDAACHTCKARNDGR